ncbi:MAG: hypothetical protein ACF8QF_11365 [Phycisphaerales bacterium]
MSERERIQEERREAAMLAGAQERRNRPLTLLGAGALVLVVCAIFALVSLVSVRSARLAYEVRRRQAGELQQVAAQIEQARAAASRGRVADRFAPERNLLTKLQSVSDRVGLERQPTLNPQNPQRFEADSPLVRRPIDVSITSATAGQITQWLDLAEAQVPGLHVISLQLRPDPAGWNARITLARWEMSS